MSAPTRAQVPFQIVIQVDNPISGVQFNGANILIGYNVVVDDGKIVGQPANYTIPMYELDLTDDLLQVIQQRLATLGLTVTRTPKE